MTTLNFKRLGRILSADGRHDWCRSHISNAIYSDSTSQEPRIYFTSRDSLSRSHIGSCEYNLDTPLAYSKLTETPLLAPGPVGYFDDSGVSLGSLVTVDSKIYLYYVGWCLGVSTPFRNSIGLAISEDNGVSFQKYSRAPIMDRHELDPVSLSYPFVMRESGRFRMWYGSNLTSGKSTEEMKHGIKYAESSDGITWERSEQICIAPNSEELGISRPSVHKSDDGYHMWYSFREPEGPYALGYAHSSNGIEWHRDDKRLHLTGSPGEWEKQMQCYPSVFQHAGKLHLLYSGNDYGRGGAGIAVQEALISCSGHDMTR